MWFLNSYVIQILSGQSIGIVNLEHDVVRLIHIKSNLRIVSKTGHTKASYFSLVPDTATHVVIKTYDIWLPDSVSGEFWPLQPKSRDGECKGARILSANQGEQVQFASANQGGHVECRRTSNGRVYFV